MLHLVHGSPLLDPLGSGGTERYVHAIALARGDAVLLPGSAAPPGSPYPVFPVDLPAPRTFRATWSRPPARRALRAALARWRPEVVHVHHLAHLDLGLPAEARRAGAAVVITLHDHHLACARGQLVDRHLEVCLGPRSDRCAGCLAEHLRLRPWMAWAERPLRRLGLRGRARAAVAAIPPGPLARQRAAARIRAGRAALDAADLVLVPSRHHAARTVALGLVDPQRVRRIDLPLVAPLSPAPDPPPGPVRFLFVGPLVPTKGPHLLVEAFARLGSAGGATLVLRGPAPGFDAAPGFAAGLLRRVEAVPGVRWAGPFADADRQAAYADADVLVLPSTWEENSPLVVREAMAVGLRVVATRPGGAGEIDPDARLVPAGDVEALAAALRAEAARGRGRRPPVDRPLGRHLQELEEAWRIAVRRRRTAPGRHPPPRARPTRVRRAAR